MKYDIDEIEIGDEVYFESTANQSNRDEYWTVTGKLHGQLTVKLDKFGFNEHWTIAISEVKYHTPLNKTEKE